MIEEILVYGEENNLILNVAKTREVKADFRRRPAPLQPLTIQGPEVERVDSNRFLGPQVMSDLSWSLNTAAPVKKAQQRLYFIRLLRKSG